MMESELNAIKNEMSVIRDAITTNNELVKYELKGTRESIENFIKENLAYEIETMLDLFSQQPVKLGNDNVTPKKPCLQLKKTAGFEREEEINSLCFLNDKRLVSCSREKTINVYSLKAYRPEIVIKNAHDWSISSVCGLKDGNLASASEKIKIWEIKDTTYKLLHTLSGHTSSINKLITLENGNLCSCSSDKSIKIWKNKKDFKCIQTLNKHIGYVMSVLEFKGFLVSVGSSFDNSVNVWSKGGNSEYSLTKSIDSVYAYTRNGLSKFSETKIIVGGKQEIFVIDLMSLKLTGIYRIGKLEGSFCLLTLEDGNVLIGNKIGYLFLFEGGSMNPIFFKRFHNNSVNCLLQTQDKDRDVISCSSDGRIFIYKLQ